jgi:hypothetical protein
MAPSRQGRVFVPNSKEVAPRKERRAFHTILLAAVVIAILGFFIARHMLATQHEPAAVNTQNIQH